MDEYDEMIRALRGDDDPEYQMEKLAKALASANEQIAQLQSTIRTQIDINDGQAKRIKQLETIGRCPNCNCIVVGHITCDKCGAEAEHFVPEFKIAELQQENAKLRSAIATPEVYAGIVSEVVEKDFVEQIAKLQQELNDWRSRAKEAENENKGYKSQQEYQAGVIEHDVKAIVNLCATVTEQQARITEIERERSTWHNVEL
jgi:hypothetical protein